MRHFLLSWFHSLGYPLTENIYQPFEDPVLIPAFLPPSGSKVGTPAARPVLATPSGLSTPHLVAAIGSLRTGSEQLDDVVIEVALRTAYISLDNGDGTVAAPTSVSINVVNAVATGVAIGDVTGDGKPDLVVADAGNNAIIVLPGNGNGTFATPVSYSLGATPVSPGAVAIADLNGDGTLDIVTGNIGSVTVLLNNGSGGFLPAVTYAAPVSATCTGGCGAVVTLGDLNGDGRPDIATTTTLAPDATQIAVLVNHGDGTFAAATLSTVGGGPVAIAIGDLNGDNKPDLAVANNRDSTASILLNNGSGTFAAQVVYPVGANPLAVTLSDQDRDGKLDLLTADRSGAVTTLHGRGDGTFARIALSVGNGPQDVITPILTSSGRHDLVIANTADKTLSVLLNNGDGTFTSAAGSPIALASAPNTLAAADFTGDNHADLAVATAAGAVLLSGSGDGSFGTPAALPVPGAFFTALAAADLGNGHQDLVLASTNGTQVQVLLNNGTGTFTAAPGSPIALGAIPHGLVVADLGTGHPDLIVSLENYGSPASGAVAVLLGDGTGQFTAAPSSPIVVGAAVAPGVAVADVTGDSKQDLVVLSTASGTANDTVSVRPGHGDGTFGAPVALPKPLGTATPTFGALTVADLDGDGALDIAVTDSCPGPVACVALYRGNGSGAFAVAGVYEFGQNSRPVNELGSALRAVDLGGGYPDLVTVGGAYNAFTGTFTGGVVNLLRNRFVPPSAATHLIFSAPLPATLAASTPIGVAVAAADASGKLVTGFGGTISLSLNGGTGLSGTLTQTAVVGGTLFLGLSVATAGTGLTLTATSGPLTGTSSAFSITGTASPPIPLPAPRPPGVPVQGGPPAALPPPRPGGTDLGMPNPLPRPR